MVCSSCSKSFDGTAAYCSACGCPLNLPGRYPQGPLFRARYGRMIAGVCAGFANAYRFDVTLTRIVVAVLAIFSAGTVAVAYILAWIIMPLSPYALPTPPEVAAAS